MSHAAAFDDNMAAFYMAFAENNLEQVCIALRNMRVAVEMDSNESSNSIELNKNQEIELRKEILQACETKASTLSDNAKIEMQKACAVGNDLQRLFTAYFICEVLHTLTPLISTFSKSLSSLFSTQTNEIIDNIYQAKQSSSVNEHGYIERQFYVSGISTLLTGATDLMNHLADTTTNAEVIYEVIKALDEVTGGVALEILHLYSVDARLSAWERRAQQSLKTMVKESSKEEEIESDESLQMVDLILDEVSCMLRLLMSYMSFRGSLHESFAQEDRRLTTDFSVKTQELNAVYLMLERFYLQQSVNKATVIAEAQELSHNVYVTSLVEDVSFVLNKVFLRASQCYNYSTALSIVIAIVDICDTVYLPSIQELPSRSYELPELKLPNQSTGDNNKGSKPNQESQYLVNDDVNKVESSFSDLLLQAVDSDLSRSIQEERKLIMAINSSLMSREVMNRLEQTIRIWCKTTFPSEMPILECLPKPLAEVQHAFHSIVENEVETLWNQSLLREIEPIAQQQLFKLDYVLTSESYDALGIHGSRFNLALKHGILEHQMLLRLESQLCLEAFYMLMVHLVTGLTAWMEAAFLGTNRVHFVRFNDLGGLELERELNETMQLLSQFIERRHRSRSSSDGNLQLFENEDNEDDNDTKLSIASTGVQLRAKFTKLNHISLVLNLMEPQDILLYLESTNVEEKYSTSSILSKEFNLQEIEKLLHMRVDFKREDIGTVIGTLKKKQIW